MTTQRPDWIDRWARRGPWLVLAYVATLAALRLWLSPHLEVDEAHFVGQTDLRLAYGNSHPPLYNWLMHVALALTGGAWAPAAAAVKFPLLAAFHLLTWDAARRLGGSRAALGALAASAFLPQIVWMSALTLTHSVLVLASAAAVVHAGALLALSPPERRHPRLWLWFGAAMALGAMSKYSFALFLGPYLAALWMGRETRGIIADRRVAISAALFAFLAGPSLIAASLQMRQTTARMSKLFSTEGATSGLDLPGIGLDGFLSLLQAGAAWAGPALIVWWLARRGAAPAPAFPDRRADAYVQALGRTMLASLAVFAAIVLAGDMHRVRERYLTPALAALPVWLAAARPLEAPRLRALACLAAFAYVMALVGVAGVTTFSAHRLAYPYDALAAQIAGRADVEGAVIVGARHVDGANLALALQRRGLDVRAAEAPWPGQPEPAGRQVLVWEGRGPRPASLRDRRAAEGPPFVVSAPLANRSGAVAAFSVEIVPPAGHVR
ncbi:ArnT family glycosyltransferase [Oceanicella actignis]|uniref:4-amino-4-deoxy-L-arabinose transferase n=1 Tax=Oceanicella actignis TaxID=1189325 RepID=A0A1M7T5G9_9RHOB|nr:glycosyltransferase family 39 protein [Oceanicella actignis]SET43119.1 4-amino-4-deoxy-L-arabinose transferase [Oceanicella actignis]SHN65928.1 4-amino-4-deoxy-L-arabinose transferase [Oceanicella actignis]